MTGTFEEKNASRVGRYKARQDLMKNPARLMSYSDENMNVQKMLKQINKNIAFFEKLGGSFSFISSYFKDKSEYEKYKKRPGKKMKKSKRH